VKGYVSQLLLMFDVTNRTELVGLLTSDCANAWDAGPSPPVPKGASAPSRRAEPTDPRG